MKNLLSMGYRVTAAKRSREEREDTADLLWRNFDFTDNRTWEACLEGVSRVFLMRPPHISNIGRDMYPFMKYLKRKGVKQVVFLSVQGVENNRLVPHYKVEKFLGELEIPSTFIRPGFFMQNLTTTHLSEIRDERIVYVPAGKGKTNFIDVRDIGEIMARMFADDTHIGKAYTVTGEKSYSYDEIAAALTGGLGREIRYANPDPFSFIIHHLRRGRKLAMTLVMLVLYSVVKSGKGDISTTTSVEILERETIGLDRFIQDHKAQLTGE